MTEQVIAVLMAVMDTAKVEFQQRLSSYLEKNEQHILETFGRGKGCHPALDSIIHSSVLEFATQARSLQLLVDGFRKLMSTCLPEGDLRKSTAYKKTLSMLRSELAEKPATVTTERPVERAKCCQCGEIWDLRTVFHCPYCHPSDD